VPRAAYDDDLLVYANDGAGGVGAFKFSSPARFVPKLHQSFIFPLEVAFVAYVNWSGAAASAGNADYGAPGTGDHFNTCDLVEMASSPGVFYYVVRVAIIGPPTGPPYRRAWLA